MMMTMVMMMVMEKHKLIESHFPLPAHCEDRGTILRSSQSYHAPGQVGLVTIMWFGETDYQLGETW